MCRKRVQRAPTKPGEFLLEDYMQPNQISVKRLSQDIGEDENTIREIINGSGLITQSIAIKLAEYFHMDGEFWIRVQENCDTYEKEKKR